jgi:hypothetical protein
MPDDQDVEYYAASAKRARMLALASTPEAAKIYLEMAAAYDSLSTSVIKLLGTVRQH